MNQILELFQSMRIILPQDRLETSRVQWNPHPVFPGVWLKNLVLGKDTHGLLSCHLVRVEKGMSIGGHIHEKSLELHEVLAGEGQYRDDERQEPYQPGVCLVVPAGVRHEVLASQEEDLYLLAKFAPALS